jgi:hypothetical protein
VRRLLITALEHDLRERGRPAHPEPPAALTVTINHSPTGNAGQLDEMFGFAESTPIDIK